VQRRGIARRILAQVRYDRSQPLHQRVEDAPQLRTVRLLAERVEEPRDIPAFGNAPFLFDADEPPQRLVALKLRQRGLDAHVPQGDAQQNNPPGDIHRTIIASASAMLPQPIQ
jgi:hypothetical protein